MSKWAYVKYKNGADRDAKRGVVYAVANDEADKINHVGSERRLKDEWGTTSEGGFWKECADDMTVGGAYDGNGNWYSANDYLTGRDNGTITW